MHDVRAVDKSISHFDEGGPPIKAYLVHNMLANFRLKRNPAFLLWVKTSDTITVWYTKYQLACKLFCRMVFLKNCIPFWPFFKNMSLQDQNNTPSSWCFYCV